MELPAEIRIRIYEFVLIDGQTSPVICTWQSPLGLPYETNLYSHRERFTEALATPCLPKLALNKQIYQEACKEFYTKRIFRFNIEQAGQLIMRLDILDQLHCVEIEDIKNQRIGLDLDFFVQSLSAAKEMEKVFLGTRALGCDPWHSKPRTSTTKLPGSDVAKEVLQAFENSPESHTLQSPTLPNVFFVNFHKRAGEKAKWKYAERISETKSRVEALRWELREMAEEVRAMEGDFRNHMSSLLDNIRQLMRSTTF